MAELGIAASIIQIADIGVKLTKRLYEFRSNAASACEQTDFIARNVTQYAQVLELLGERLDDDQPIHSKKALNLAEELYEQSYDLFDRIKSLLPNRGRFKDQLSFLQKIAWNFKKSKVELLVAEVEYLKSTVQLPVQVLYTGRKIRSYKFATPHSSQLLLLT